MKKRMEKLEWWPVVSLLCAIVIVPTSNELQGQGKPDKPVRVHHVHGDGGPVQPTSLDELWRMSGVVIRGTVVGQRPADIVTAVPGEEPSILVRTAYRIRISETFKTSPRAESASGVIEWILLGGDRDRGVYVDSYVDDSLPRPKTGEEYVLFLAPFGSASEYIATTSEPDNAFLLENETVVPRGSQNLSRTLAQSGRAALLATLRQKGRSQ